MRMRNWIGGACAVMAWSGALHAEVTVSQPWARATPTQNGMSAAYATVRSTEPDRIVGASTPAAGMAELHVSKSENGVMTMRPAGPVSLTPGAAVTLAPGGLHVMLMDLRKPLKAGDHFPLTLRFEHAAPVTVDVPVQPAGARGP